MLHEFKTAVSNQPDALNMARWCESVFLPYWARVSHDRVNGGFFDRVDSDGHEIPVGYKRTRVQGRQIFVFSHAASSGLLPSGLELATSGFEFIRKHTRDPLTEGWAFKVSSDGVAVVDSTRDLYCQAFVLFGLGWYLRATKEREVLSLIEDTLGFIDSHMSEPMYGGYIDSWQPGTEQRSIVTPRLQNPHMHLLEALLVIAETTGNQIYLDRAGALVNLWHDRFTVGATCSISEHFCANWLPVDGPNGRTHEPGHHLEWFWILQNFSRLTGDNRILERAKTMLDSTLKYGIDRAPNMLEATFDQVDTDGTVFLDTKRLWPQTETVKGLLAAYLWLDDRSFFIAAQRHLAMIMRTYLGGGEASFTEHFNAAGNASMVKYMPVSSVYHLYLCFCEFMRIAGQMDNRSDRDVCQ